MARIPPVNATGTHDYLPRDLVRRNHVFALLRETFERYGFEPLETPAIENTNVYRSPLIPVVDTNALKVRAASLNLPEVIGTSVAQGRWLNPATERQPVTVLGALAAQREPATKVGAR